jgi:hypothetical protein
VTDRKGVVRRIDLGWEPTDEARLAALVERLLTER